MEKLLWFAIGGLWTLLIGAAAVGAERNTSVKDDHQAGRPSAVVAVSSTASPLVSQARNNVFSDAVTNHPVVVLGQRSGAEVSGGFVIGGMLLYAARRRRII